MQQSIRILCAGLICVAVSLITVAAEQTDAPISETEGAPVTVGDPAVPLDELSLMVKPLTADELKVEAKAWMELLRAKLCWLLKAVTT